MSESGVDKPVVQIVDDKSENLKILMKILMEQGCEVHASINGALALKSIRTDPPDLILLDIMMPGMDGFEVCEHLKANERTRDIPVIFISALHETADKIRAFSIGGVDYITKPFQEEEVLARVETHLNQRRMQRRLEEQNQELTEAASLREDVERITRHDLKTPLNAIIGFPRIMMMDENLSAEQTEYLKMIEESGLMMLDMINLSLDMFRMERGVYQFQPVPVNVSQVIRRIINDTEPPVTAKRLSVRILTNGKPAGSEEDFSVHGEELLCYSMLANLIRNAFEASPERGRITVELAGEEEMSVIRIHNRGAVPVNIRDRFFEKYVTSGKKSGTGLGTYSARLIAETQGGSIHLDTSEEKGSTVTVRLPSCQSSVVSCQLQRTADSGQQAADETTLTSDRLKALPGECRVDLKTAAEMTSPKEANAVIDRIREHDEPLADALPGREVSF